DEPGELALRESCGRARVVDHLRHAHAQLRRLDLAAEASIVANETIQDDAGILGLPRASGLFPCHESLLVRVSLGPSLEVALPAQRSLDVLIGHGTFLDQCVDEHGHSAPVEEVQDPVVNAAAAQGDTRVEGMRAYRNNAIRQGRGLAPPGAKGPGAKTGAAADRFQAAPAKGRDGSAPSPSRTTRSTRARARSCRPTRAARASRASSSSGA